MTNIMIWPYYVLWNSSLTRIPVARICGRSTKRATAKALKRVHIAIANAKRTLLGIYHKIKGKYLQNYLDELCCELDRRYFGERLFDRPAIAIIAPYWYING